MSRGPKPGTVTKTDFVAKVRAAYGAALPDWVEALAEECTRRSAAAVAETIGYSPAVISHVLGNRYTGDIRRVEEKARGALMGASVTCPVLGELARNRCLDEQRKPFATTSSIRVRLHRACRSGCPHARLKGH